MGRERTKMREQNYESRRWADEIIKRSKLNYDSPDRDLEKAYKDELSRENSTLQESLGIISKPLQYLNDKRPLKPGVSILRQRLKSLADKENSKEVGSSEKPKN